jgi:hypothetical protein
MLSSRLKLMNIEKLKIDRCTLKSGTSFEIHAVENLYQVDSDKDFIQRMNVVRVYYARSSYRIKTTAYLIGE